MTNKSKALELYHVNPTEIQKSSSWFNEKISKMNKRLLTPNSMLFKEGRDMLTNTLKPGRMYAFVYDPKNKETLPFYDTFPLVLPYDRTATHFIGLNLHYLDYPVRFILLKELIKLSGIRTLNENSKIKYSWDMIKDVSKCAPAKACIKSYIFNHVKTPFLEIAPLDWHTAGMLPFAQFQGSTAANVYKDSKGKF